MIRVLIAAAIIFAGFMFLPAIREVLDSLITIIKETFELSEFEEAFFKFYVFIPLAMILFGAIWILIKGKKTEE